MADAATAAAAQLRANQQQARRARGQGGQISRPRTNGVNALPGRDDAFQNAQTRTLPTRPISNETLYRRQINEQQRREEEFAFKAEQNRQRILDQMRALAPLPQELIGPEPQGQQMDRDYSALQRSWNQIYRQTRQTRDIGQRRGNQRRLQFLKQQGKKLAKKKANIEELKKNLAFLYSGGELASVAEWELGAGGSVSTTGGAGSWFSIIKTILGVDKVFTDWEPPKLTIDDVDFRGLISGSGTIIQGVLFALIFVGMVVMGILQLIIGIIGMGILGSSAVLKLLNLFSVLVDFIL